MVPLDGVLDGHDDGAHDFRSDISHCGPVRNIGDDGQNRVSTHDNVYL